MKTGKIEDKLIIDIPLIVFGMSEAADGKGKDKALNNFTATIYNDTKKLRNYLLNSFKEDLAFIYMNAPEKYEKIIAWIDFTVEHRDEIAESMRNAQSWEKVRNVKPMPTGSAINTIIDVINAGQDGVKGVEALPERKNKISHTKYTVARGDPLNKDSDKFTVRHDISGGRGHVSVELSSAMITNLSGYSVATKKIFALILEKINEQAFNDGHLTRDYIEFSTQEVIERGIYSVYQSAVKGLKNAMHTLTNIKLEGEIKFRKDSTVSFSNNYMLAVLFPTAENKRGQWHIRLNDDVNWGFLLQAFSILPIYYYSLPNRASELLYLIFAIARQHTEDIKKRGYFTISFRVIQQALHLPDEDKTKHTTQDIKDVILAAIDEIEKTHRECFVNDETMLFLSPEYDDDWPITQFLNKGYLQVSLTGIFAQPFIAIEDDKTKRLKEAKRRQQKALEAKKKEVKEKQ